MKRAWPRRAKPRHRAQPERHHRHSAEIGGRVVIGQVRADPAGQVGAAGRLDRLDRTAAARALDDAHDRQVQIVRGPSPMDNKINIEGTLAKRSKTVAYRVATDGKKIVRIRADNKEYTYGELPDAGALMGDMQALIMPIFASENVLQEARDAEVKP